MNIQAKHHYAEARSQFKQTLIKDASQPLGVLGRTGTYKAQQNKIRECMPPYLDSVSVIWLIHFLVYLKMACQLLRL